VSISNVAIAFFGEIAIQSLGRGNGGQSLSDNAKAEETGPPSGLRATFVEGLQGTGVASKP